MVNHVLLTVGSISIGFFGVVMSRVLVSNIKALRQERREKQAKQQTRRISFRGLDRQKKNLNSEDDS